MSKDSNLIFLQLSRITQLKVARRRHNMKFFISTFAILMLSFLCVALTYEWKFCSEFPKAQSCSWVKLIKEKLP